MQIWVCGEGPKSKGWQQLASAEAAKIKATLEEDGEISLRTYALSLTLNGNYSVRVRFPRHELAVLARRHAALLAERVKELEAEVKRLQDEATQRG